jgi:2OG-Fe(II) oxygenase superfamily
MLSTIGFRLASRHPFRTPTTTTTGRATRCLSFVDPILDMEALQSKFVDTAPQMATALSKDGYFTTTEFLESSMIQRLRDQCVALRDNGRFEPSWSEKIVHGTAVRFDKEGVFACEPDGRDYDTAPDLIVYLSVLLQTLPLALNQQSPTRDMDLSNAAFNAKLAVTSPGGSTYPMHIDNPEGIAAGDTRKLTCILYLNPDYQEGDGGELQIVLAPDRTVDLTPQGGRLVAFWSDEVPHQVLPTAPHADKNDTRYDRYALTIWIPSENMMAIHNPASKFRTLSDIAFP